MKRNQQKREKRAEARARKDIRCALCGGPMSQKRGKYCSEACAKNARAAQIREHGKRPYPTSVRPFTDDTVFLVHKWSQEGMTEVEIADVMARPIEQVEEALATPIADPRFPDTIEEVIFQPGQYACVDNGTFWLEPTARAVRNAVAVLTGQVKCPENVVFQAEFPQGDGIYTICETTYSTTYFCFLED